MPRRIATNAFVMNTVAHQSPGLWRHPRDGSGDYNRLDHWTDIAKTLEAGYARSIDRAGALAMVGGWTGVDFASIGWDDPIRYQENDALRSHLEAITTADPDTIWTKRTLADYAGIGGIAPVICGSGGDCAEALIAFQDAADSDGYNLAHAVWSESFEDFARLVVPDLQARGPYRPAYDAGTLREKLWGQGPHVAPTHPAAKESLR